MNKLKSQFIGMFPMFAMGLAGYSLYQLNMSGLNFIWLGALMTTLPVVLFVSRVMMFKNMARTTAHFPVLTLLAVVGFAFAIYGFVQSGLTDKLALALVVTGFIFFMLYNFWYSVLGRNYHQKIEVGNQLSDFTVFDAAGNPVTASSFKGSPTVFLFFRGNWCPLCMAQIKEIATKYNELTKLGAKVALISPQPEKNTQTLAEKFDVPFLFLTDVNNAAAKALDIEMKNGLPAGMEMFGYDKNTVYPTIIITDEKGKILYNDATNNYRIRPEPQEFINVLNTNTQPA